MYQNPLKVYQQVEKQTTSGRQAEARVLTEAAAKLQYCQENWEMENREEILDEALSYNQRVWSILQGELLDDTNPMPKPLRKNILLLSAYIDKRIFNVLAYPEPEKLTIIININLNLAAGLRNNPGK